MFIRQNLIKIPRRYLSNEFRLNSFIKSKLMSAENVAQKFPENITLGASGFTPAGYPKVISEAFAQRIQNSLNPERFSINFYTSASTGDELDEVLAGTGRMKLRIPYQSHPDLRKLINQEKLNFIDMHLTCNVTPDGRVYLTNSSGMSGIYPTDSENIILLIQSGVGNVANAVLSCIAPDNRFKLIEMYTEMIQDSIFYLIDSDKLRFASTTALTFSPKGQIRFFEQLNYLKSKFILCPMEISNNPEVIRRMGFITMNTALETDIYGNVNSTHVLGSSMMNGIGGSGDFTRNAITRKQPGHQQTTQPTIKDTEKPTKKLDQTATTKQ